MNQIDLNCDLGENFGHLKPFDDNLILPHITSANVACGFHAGDAVTMQKTVLLAKQHGVAVGAHPGYPDLIGFGRRNMAVSADELYAYVKYQIGALSAFTKAADHPLVHVKPHGAMYNMAADDIALANAIAKAVYDVDDKLILVGLAGSAIVKAGHQLGLQVAQEVFADRRYLDNGRLVPRSEEYAVITDVEQATEQVLQMLTTGKVTTLSGNKIDIVADTLCLHGDNQNAVDFAIKIKQQLLEHDIKICTLSSIVG